METEPPRKLFTPGSANRMLPAIRERLVKLRTVHRTLLSLQGKVDIEELAGTDAAGVVSEAAKAKIAEYEGPIREAAGAFEEQIEEFHALGCELKDLEQGLVDFYALREGKLVFLCWHEGEDEVAFWHPLEGGYAGRQPL